jgi:hypothetical protein
VELLLTFEEFCGQEGDFEGTGERGADFANVFAQARKKDQGARMLLLICMLLLRC